MAKKRLVLWPNSDRTLAETPLWFGIVFFGVVAVALIILLGTFESRERRLTLSLTSHKEEMEVSPTELDAKVEELTHQGDVRRIVVMDDLGEYVMETTVTPKGTETKRFNITWPPNYPYPRTFSPLRYTIIVERKEEGSHLENHV